MAINRISVSGAAGMLYGMPVNKPSRVVNVDSGNRANVVATAALSQTAVQGTSGARPADTSGTAEQVHAAFEYALAAFQGNAGTTGGAIAQSSPDQGQSGAVQQAGVAAYAQVEQASGQVLDLTA